MLNFDSGADVKVAPQGLRDTERLYGRVQARRMVTTNTETERMMHRNNVLKFFCLKRKKKNPLNHLLNI